MFAGIREMQSGIALARLISKKLRKVAKNSEELDKLKRRNPELYRLYVEIDKTLTNWIVERLQNL